MNGDITRRDLSNGLNSELDSINTQLVDISTDVEKFYLDSETDDTNMFQRAIDSLPSSGGVLLLKQGKSYNVNSKVNINKPILINGNNATINVNFTNLTTEIFSISADNVTIENIKFVGNGTIGVFAYKAFIYSNKQNTIVDKCRFESGMQGVIFASGCTHSKITNCLATNMQGSGYLILGTSHNMINNCTAISCGDGAISLFNAKNCSVGNCEVYTSDQGITIDSGSRFNIIVGNKVFGDLAGTTAKSGYYGIDLKNNSHDNVVQGNTVVGCVVGIAARYGDAAGLQATCSNNIIKGNTISEGSKKGFAVASYGIYIQAQYGLIVESNSISRTDGVYIYAENIGSYNSNLIIKSNNLNLHGNNFGDLSYKAINQTAISITGYDGVIVVENNIQNAPEVMTVHSIKLNNCSFFNINSNTFKSITYRAINILGSSYGEISNNLIIITNSLGWSIELNSTGYIKIQNNYQGGASGYFVSGGNANYTAENNVFNGTYADSLGGTGTKRLFNNENRAGSGINGAQLRNNGNNLEIWNGSTWVVVGTQS